MKKRSLGNPFRIHGLVSGNYFTNRDDELKRLVHALKEPGSKLHAYPDAAHTAITPRVHVQDGPMYPCIDARKSVVLSGRRFSAHYRRPLMARISD